MSDKSHHERTAAELKRLPWTKGLSETAIEDIVSAGEYVHLQADDIVHRADEKLTSVFIVASGRLLATVVDLYGNKVLEKALIRGAVFGLFSFAQPEQTNTNLVATEPTTGVRIGIEPFLELLSKHPDLQMNIYRLAGELVRQIVMVDRKKSQPSVVGVVHQSAISRPLTQRLVRRLQQIENAPCVAGDDPNWQPVDGVSYRLLVENGQLISLEQRRLLLKEWADLGRVFIDLDANQNLDHLVRLLSFADAILWCVGPNNVGDAIRILRVLLDKSPGWRDKICLVWLLDGDNLIAPYVPELSEFVQRDFKLSFAEPAKNQGSQLQLGLERIVHFLRGVEIGIALGGGAARGMAHLGVLKELEEQGIYLDLIAGTSAGAMTGTLYASGMEVEHTIQSFKKELALPWFFRMLPGGGYWYLVYKYRRNKFDPMLRKYLGDIRLEQLPIPMLTVTVDLVSGDPVVRESGDATRGILESINLPGLSPPIIGDGEALVDGGLLNNIPADVLVSKGSNFVMASSVTAKLEQDFVGIRAGQTSHKQKSPSTLKVILRGQLVQSFNMNSIGVQPADLVIEPDVTAFDLAAFERADEMAAVGQKATSEIVSKIKKQLAKLDKDLFPFD